MNFLKSKSLGDIGENLLIQELKAKENITDCGLNADKSLRYEFDVWATIKNNRMTFEIKYDLYSERSGNIAIEIWNSKKNEPSGLTATKADYWVHILNEDGKPNVYITKVKTLKDFVSDTKPFRTITGGGDNNADLYLYKKEDILPIFSLLLNWTFE